MLLTQVMPRAVLLVSVALSLGACGSDGIDASNTADSQPAITPTTPPMTTPPGITPPAASIECASIALNDALAADKLFQSAPFNTIIPDLITAIIDPNKQKTTDLAGPIARLKMSGTAQQCEMALFIKYLTAADDLGTLSPLVLALNSVVTGLNKGLSTEQVTNGLASLLAISDHKPSQGVITSVNTLTGNLLNGTLLSPVNNLLDLLLNPQSGVLAPITGAVDKLTDINTGALAAVSNLVNTLVNTNDQALNPLISLLNSILGGRDSGQTSDEIASGLLALAKGDLFTAVMVLRIPFYGELLARTAPVKNRLYKTAA